MQSIRNQQKGDDIQIRRGPTDLEENRLEASLVPPREETKRKSALTLPLESLLNPPSISSGTQSLWLAHQLCSSFLLFRRANMSFGGPSMGSGSATVRRAFDFGRTHVVRPKGKHQATVVWLHGLGDNGASWSQLLETLPLPNIKWICPTAPSQPISLFGGFPSTAWFDVTELSENVQDDLEGLEASAAHVASLLSTEPTDIKLAVGGFSMGAAASLYSATCFALGKYNNGNPFPAIISAAVGLSGWVPCSKTLNSQLQGKDEAARRAASLPILLCHGKGDDVVPFKFGEKSAKALSSSGFQDVTFKAYNGLGHYTTPEEMDDICSWLSSKLGLEGRS